MTGQPPPSTPQLAEPTFAAADRNVGLFVAFRVLFNARFYYPVFMVMFLDYGITLEEFALLNAIWAAASGRIVGTENGFRAVVGLLPWGFLLACAAFSGFCMRLGPDRTALARPGGFGQPPAPSA